MENVCIIKKDGTKEKYNVEKVGSAVKKSAARMLIEFSNEKIDKICTYVNKNVAQRKKNEINILEIRNIVESVLDLLHHEVV